MRAALVRVWADIVDHGKCRWCRKPLVWRTMFDRKGTIPFNVSTTSYGVVKDDRGRKIETLCWNDKHACASRPKQTRKPAATVERWTPRPPQGSFF